MSDDATLSDHFLDRLAARAGAYDQTGEWPEHDLDDLTAVGMRRWAVPIEYGGDFGDDALDALALHRLYEQIASASLATALIVTQHDSAVGMIAASENQRLRETVLPRVAEGNLWTTVGISQLTTARDRGRNVKARLEGDGVELDGYVPWSTGAAEADELVIAAPLPEPGMQIACLVQSEDERVCVNPPPTIVGLSATRTTSLDLTHLHVPPHRIVAGPAQSVLGRRLGKVPIGQVFLAMGHTAGAIALMRREQSGAGDAPAEALERELKTLRKHVEAYCLTAEPDPAIGDRLRAHGIELATRACYSAVAVHKGAALVEHHDAQRLAREALFLLVWSCPGGVRECTLERMTAGPRSGEC